MRALIWLLVLFAVAAGLAVAARYNDGYVLIVANPWRIELSLNFLVVLLVAGFAALYGLLRLVTQTLAMPSHVAAFRARKRHERAIDALVNATRLQLEGRHGQALKRAQVAYDCGASPGLTALLAARAAGALRDEPRKRLWLDRACEHDAEFRTARLMTEVDIALQARQFDEASERLDLLRASGQRHIAALRLSLRVAQARGESDEMLRLARQLEKHRALSAEEALPIKRRANLANLQARQDDRVALARYWIGLPDDEQGDRRVAEAAARALCAAGDPDTAQKLLERWLDTQWDSAMAELYGECGGGDLLARIGRAETWLKRQPRDARLLLMLGRLCLQNELWGKAQSYLEAALSLEPLRAAHLELARLHERLGRESEAQRHYRDAAIAEA
ncbi:MAG: heme biosynthesis protein HemY [Sterolibacteriaceae bacterium]|nr:heme biosynthesis protein HemY [Sterolibacteriaceae bacterium]